MARHLFLEALSNLDAVCSSDYPEQVAKATEMLVRALSSGRKLLVFGNGGSAADAEHIAGEIVGRFLKERKGLPAIALVSNPAIVTAVANDYDFKSIFARQINALAVPGDVAWAISTSGKSPNVIEGLKAARNLGAATLGLTGRDGGQMAPWCDLLLAPPCSSTTSPRIQEVHAVTYHIICAGIEEKLFGS